jgi:hypothetical protein
MICKKVLLVFFSTLNVVFNEPFCFSALICFNEPFYICVPIKLFYLSKPFCFSGLVWCFRVLCWSFFLLCLFYSIFNELVCFGASTYFNEAFYLSASINLFTSLSCGLLRFCVGFLLYSNVVLNEPLCFNDLFLLQTTFLPFYLGSFFDSMDCGILCSKVLIL